MGDNRCNPWMWFDVLTLPAIIGSPDNAMASPYTNLAQASLLETSMTTEDTHLLRKQEAKTSPRKVQGLPFSSEKNKIDPKEPAQQGTLNALPPMKIHYN